MHRCFFFNDTATTEIYTLSLPDALPIWAFLPLSDALGRIAAALAAGTSVDAVEIEYLGRIAERDTRLLTVQVLKGILRGHTEEDVNDVNAPSLAEERGIEVAETSRPHARDLDRKSVV